MRLTDGSIIGMFVAALAGGIWLNAGAQGETVQPPPPSPYDGDMAVLDRAALDDAYRQQMAHLFLNWMRDESGQPGRAITGANRARRAYVAVMREIEKREKRP